MSLKFCFLFLLMTFAMEFYAQRALSKAEIFTLEKESFIRETTRRTALLI